MRTSIPRVIHCPKRDYTDESPGAPHPAVCGAKEDVDGRHVIPSYRNSFLLLHTMAAFKCPTCSLLMLDHSAGLQS